MLHILKKKTMKKIFSLLAVAALVIAPSMAQEKESLELSDKEIIKKGWNFGPLPVVGFDSDLGFQYGVCCDIFNYGDGSHYPSYDYKVNVEASRYTKGSSVLRTYGDFKSLIPDGKLFFDVTYFSAPKFEFYGFNGFASPYYDGSIYGTTPAAIADPFVFSYPSDFLDEKSAFNWMSRNQFRAIVSMQKKIVGHLNWSAGLAYYNIRTGAINREKLGGYDGQTTLYELYRHQGLIGEDEADGGNVTQLRAGLIYDSRNHDSDPTRGLNVEATFYVAPDVIDGKGYSNGGITFLGSQYVPIVGDKLTFAYRLGAQYTLFGKVPYYFANNMNTMFFRRMYTEGLGGNTSVRGIHRNGVIGDGFTLLNTELRWRIVEFRFINQNWGVALNPFFDCGQIGIPHLLDEQKAAAIQVYDNYLINENLKPSDETLIYSGNPEALHCSAGAGVKLVMNHNMVVSFEAAKAFDANDGTGLWTNIGFNYMF